MSARLQQLSTVVESVSHPHFQALRVASQVASHGVLRERLRHMASALCVDGVSSTALEAARVPPYGDVVVVPGSRDVQIVQIHEQTRAVRVECSLKGA